MPQLHEILRTPGELLALEPEELGAVLLEVAPSVSQHAGFTFNDIINGLYAGMNLPGRQSAYSYDSHGPVSVALAEALSWLEAQGLIVRNPHQSGPWYILTRRAARLGSRVNLAAYQAARTLPLGVLQTEMVEKVRNLFARGDYDVAVFQAFKMVEIEVRKITGLPPELPAQAVMRRAFHPEPETGPLTDKDLPSSEQQAMSDLFAGAMGHAKNPPSHRDVDMHVRDAARLILFASYLLDLVHVRALVG